jgi:hypothetical protein
MFSMGTAYSDVPPQGAVLIGFNYSLGTWVNRTIIASLQPIFLTADGEKLGDTEGNVTGTVKSLRAKSGYVVTCMRVGAGGNLDGLGLVFTRLIGTRLDPTDNFESAWIGNTLDTERREEADGVVVGICGKKKENIGSVTLVTVPLDAVLPPRRDADNAAIAGPADAPSSAQVPAPPAPVGPIGFAPSDPPPAQGQPYTSFQQMFETLPENLKPHNGTWLVGRRVSPELSHRLGGQPAVMTAEFASVKNTADELEVTLDAGDIEYRGIHLTGQILARFPAGQAAAIHNLRIHDRVTITGTINQMVVRGSGFDTAFVWIKDCQLK